MCWIWRKSRKIWNLLCLNGCNMVWEEQFWEDWSIVQNWQVKEKIFGQSFHRKILSLGTTPKSKQRIFNLFDAEDISERKPAVFKELKSGIVTFFLLTLNAETKKVPRKKTRRPWFVFSKDNFPRSVYVPKILSNRSGDHNIYILLLRFDRKTWQVGDNS